MEERIISVNGIDYIVSYDGKVYSTHNCGRAKYHQEISQRKNEDGYMTITTGKTGNRRRYRVHRMVAEAFIPNPDNLPEVNHKDNNRANNCVDNLEWCTHQYNVQYAIDSGNHISTRDLTGENNPNYDNHTLKEKYKKNPELARKNNSRMGSINGRARRIRLVDTVDDEEMEFDYMRSAAKYLILNGFTKAKNVDSVCTRLAWCAKTKNKYKQRFCVEFVD